jgi:predicted amidophosphoribosyltransferase
MRTLDALISCGPYEGALEESLKELKYGFRRELAKPLARELAVAFVRLPARPDLLTWDPAARQRLGMEEVQSRSALG